MQNREIEDGGIGCRKSDLDKAKMAKIDTSKIVESIENTGYHKIKMGGFCGFMIYLTQRKVKWRYIEHSIFCVKYIS